MLYTSKIYKWQWNSRKVFLLQGNFWTSLKNTFNDCSYLETRSPFWTNEVDDTPLELGFGGARSLFHERKSIVTPHTVSLQVEGGVAKALDIVLWEVTGAFIARWLLWWSVLKWLRRLCLPTINPIRVARKPRPGISCHFSLESCTTGHWSCMWNTNAIKCKMEGHNNKKVLKMQNLYNTIHFWSCYVVWCLPRKLNCRKGEKKQVIVGLYKLFTDKISTDF